MLMKNEYELLGLNWELLAVVDSSVNCGIAKVIVTKSTAKSVKHEIKTAILLLFIKSTTFYYIKVDIKRYLKNAKAYV